MECNNCESFISVKIKSKSKVKSKLTVRFAPQVSIIADAKLSLNSISKAFDISSPVVSTGKVKARLNLDSVNSQKIDVKAKVRQKNNVNFDIAHKVTLNGNVVSKLDKFVGNFSDTSNHEKLYPDFDYSNFMYLPSSGNNLSNLIDEGVYSGPYHVNDVQSQVFFDDSNYIYSNNKAGANVTFGLSSPTKSFVESKAIIRASSNSAYKIYDIEFRDPIGRVICKYEDILVSGDSAFTTYSSSPVIDNGSKYSWDEDYITLDQNTGPNDSGVFYDNFNIYGLLQYSIQNTAYFTLNFKTLVQNEDRFSSFDNGFDDFFDDIDFGSRYIKISAAEIANSGLTGFTADDFIPFFVGVQEQGYRIEKSIKPQKLYQNDLIYPVVNSVWQGTYGHTSNDELGRVSLANQLSESYDYTNTVLMSGVAGSGDLKLEFGLKDDSYSFSMKGGEFSLAFDNREFPVARITKDYPDKSWFIVDEIFLKVRAKKPTGGANFALDVVGYTDDGLLNISTPFNFLDNTSVGSGTLPNASGWNNLNNESISGEAISDMSEYFEGPAQGANHYKLSSDIVVDSESFKDYMIPLSILKKEGIGEPKDYSQSPSFERLFLDIYPIPVGAAFSNVELVVTYKPSNALALNTLGGNLARIETGRSETLLKPIAQGPTDDIVNAGSGYALPSLISNIPHGYTTPQTIKTNYARRWTGVEGSVVAGDFNPYEFDFSFYNPQLSTPFVNGYYDFSETSGNYVLPRKEAYSLAQPIQFSSIQKLKNVGLRQGTKTIFPDSPHIYESVANSVVKASDAYDTVVYGAKTASVNVNTSGFTIYLKFTPRNFDEYYTLISNADFSLDIGLPTLNEIRISSAPYSDTLPLLSDEQYPLHLILTYNEQNNGKLCLYTKYDSNSSIQKTEIEASIDQVLVNFNFPNELLLHELGLSHNNLVDEDVFTPNLLNKEISVQSFLRGKCTHWSQPGDLPEDNLYALPSYIDESTLDFKLGDFKNNEFTSEFDMFQTRVGKDFINFRFNGSGEYNTQLENDFLRFNLSDTAENFYSTNIRIEKDLISGYLFNKRAIVAQTVVDYSQDGSIVWADGKVGPKLIVSLYSKNNYTEEMYPDIVSASGDICLINRKEFYLDPYMSWERLDCTFDPETYWGYNKPHVFEKEFAHKYFSDNVDTMFLQYDLEIPSGNSIYDVNLNIHAATVVLEDAIVKASEIFSSINICSQSEEISVGTLPLTTYAYHVIEDDLILHALATATPSDNESMNMVSLGGTWSNGVLSLITDSHLLNNEDLLLHTNCQFVYSFLNLLAFNDEESISSSIYLSLVTEANYNPKIRSSLNLLCFSSVFDPRSLYTGDETLSFVSFTDIAPIGSIAADTLNLYVPDNTEAEASLNLFAEGLGLPPTTTDSNLNLYTIVYPLVYLNGVGSEYISWNSKNIGRSTQEFDEQVLSIPASADIRDQQGICYGDCSTSGTCQELEVETHGTIWNEAECVQGGILRPFKLNNSGENPDYYDGGFYGARKYTGLYPNTAYDITVAVKTGSTDFYDVPNILEEWEYGTLGDIKYSGVKLVPDDIVTQDNYGKTVKTKGDLTAVSAPGRTVGGYEKAGSVFLYRREDEIAGEKAPWILEEELTLPSGFIDDYFYQVPGRISVPGLGTIPETQWQIGQEGREFGHSLDLAKTPERELLVVGGPGAKWSRTFDNIETSGVNFALFIFSDEFSSDSYYFDELWKKIEDNNFIFKYFAEPAVHVNMKIINIFPTGIFTPQIPSYANPNVFTHTIPRTILNRQIDEPTQDFMLEEMKAALHAAYPFNSGEINNNIPAIVGFYVDNSRSLGRKAVEPAIDRFFSFYQDYAFQSGVKDFYGVPSSGYVYEKVLGPNTLGESHLDISKHLIDEILDTGVLRLSGNINLLTSGVGVEFANSGSIEFNLTPDSGGRVYVFEKFSHTWDLIQQINSPDNVYTKLPNRFGHSVSISDNGKTIAVGSPFIRESCSIYELDTSERERLYASIGDWLVFRNESNTTQGQYQEKIDRFNILETAFGTVEAGRTIYNELNTTDKFRARSDRDFWSNNSIQEFKKVYSYGINDVEGGIKGQFPDVPRRGAPNPRLGYSTSINSDGSIVAFGSPTDSLGIYENADFYFKHEFYLDPENSGLTLPVDGTWASNVNAGAVRVFEKERLVVPTNKNLILEYNKFGNLSNSLNGTENYDELGNETNSTEISQIAGYQKTDFADFRIPDETGAIFIVTPEIDAVNDEVIAEIKRWLSLGDRRLVLVGDDPVWEKNGAYAQSNAILNKILDRLESRMRLYPARNQYEALLVDNNYGSGNQFKTNVIESSIPAGSNPTSVNINQNLNAFGVADIRFHAPDITFTDENWGEGNKVVNGKKYGICSPFNPVCGPPIGDNGDLRAQWIERELRFPPPKDDSDPYAYWSRNLPFEYFTNGLPPVFPDKAAKIGRDININNKGMQPRPLMVAAEFKGMTGIIPAIPEIKQITPIVENTTIQIGDVNEYYLFGESGINEVSFLWKEGSGIFNSINMNVTNNPSPGAFYNPDKGLTYDGILQAKGSIFTNSSTTEVFENVIYDDALNIVARQEFDESQIYLLACVDSENYTNISESKDHNISFYDNLVRNNGQNSKIIQLAGWTGRNSIKEGFADSLLPEIFNSLGHTLEEGWSDTIPSTRDVVWIANATGVPTQQEAEAIRSWLRNKNKKLVITYEGTQKSALVAYNICQQLGMTIRPWILPESNAMAMWNNKNTLRSDAVNLLNIAEKAVIGYTQNSRVDKFSFSSNFCPIQIEQGFRVAHNPGQVFDKKLKINEEFTDIIKLNTGVAKVEFPVLPGSGYRIYYRWFSDFPGETQELDLYFGDVHYKDNSNTKAQNPATATAQSTATIYDYDRDGNLILVDSASVKKVIRSVSFGDAVEEAFIDIQVPFDKNYINLYVSGNRSNVPLSNTQIPRTCKLLDVSGVLLPINKVSEISTSTITESRIVGYEETITQQAVPARTITLPASVRPIMTDNTKYCIDGDDCGGTLVADGPVVMAEEPETFSNFVSGNNRSTIVLISDSSLVNGRSDKDEYGPSSSGDAIFMTSTDNKTRIQNLINSLTTIKSNENTSERIKGVYTMTQKIVSPETGSVGVYALETQDALVRFNGTTNNNSILDFTNESNFDESKIVRHLWPVPPNLEEDFKQANERVSGEFDTSMSNLGFNSKFKYEIEGEIYEDSSIMGNPFSKLLAEKGVDFIDEQMIASGGYPGDLFGYSVCISGPKGKEKIFVGSPFNGWKGEVPINYSGINNLNDLDVGNDGGAGAAFLFKKDNQLGWVNTKKFKPETLHTSNSDRFGYTIDSDGDLFVVGAPCHDYTNQITQVSGEFVRKDFNAEFNIGTRVVTDLGSGTFYQNAGATYTFEDKLYDWSTRSKKWELREKVRANGVGHSQTNSNFGRSVSISRNSRLDSDYTMVNGSLNTYPSGQAGAAYVNDAMLRFQPPSQVNDQSWFSVNVFGSNKSINFVRIDLTDLQNRDEEYIYVSGRLYTDEVGQIIMEASGQDPRELSFITQRPYVERIEGNVVRGLPSEGNMYLHTFTDAFSDSSNLNLYTIGPDSDTVYNSLNIVSMSANTDQDILNLTSFAVDPTIIENSGLILHTDGIGILNSSLDLRIRGK